MASAGGPSGNDGTRAPAAPGGLTVTVLGSAGTFGHAGNPCSGYLVRSPGATVWLDAGPGTLSALQEHVALADVTAIVLTHEHPDHWLELPVVRNAAKYVLGIESLPVHGTAGTLRLAEHLVDGDLAPLGWYTIADGHSTVIGDLELTFSRTDHPVETLAVGATHDGRRFAYSADTGSGWTFAALDPEGDGFDLALCEATLEERHADLAQHLTATQAGHMARDSRVRRLVLTHLYADTDAERSATASSAFGRPVEVAQPGITFSV